MPAVVERNGGPCFSGLFKPAASGGSHRARARPRGAKGIAPQSAKHAAVAISYHSSSSVAPRTRRTPTRPARRHASRAVPPPVTARSGPRSMRRPPRWHSRSTTSPAASTQSWALCI